MSKILIFYVTDAVSLQVIDWYGIINKENGRRKDVQKWEKTISFEKKILNVCVSSA